MPDLSKRRIGTTNDITVTVKKDGMYIMGTIQSYSVKCVLDVVKIPAMGESVPTSYYHSGRTYTINLKKVNIMNTTFKSEDTEGKSIYRTDIWNNFELIITKHGIEGGKDIINTYRNCFRIEAGEEADVGGCVYDTVTIVSHNVDYADKDTEYNRRRKMKFGSFEFPYNPYETEFTSERKYVEHKLPGLKYNDLEDFGLNSAVIHCAGYFYQDRDDMTDGKTALKNWKKLYNIYKEGGVKKLYHPIFTNITKAMMVNLHCKMEGKSSLLQYDFDLIEYRPSKTENVKKKSSSKKPSAKSSGKKSGKVNGSGVLVSVGDSVYMTGVLNGKKYNHVKMTVTKLDKDGINVHLGTVGWAPLDSLSWS